MKKGTALFLSAIFGPLVYVTAKHLSDIQRLREEEAQANRRLDVVRALNKEAAAALRGDLLGGATGFGGGLFDKENVN